MIELHGNINYTDDIYVEIDNKLNVDSLIRAIINMMSKDGLPVHTIYSIISNNDHRMLFIPVNTSYSVNYLFRFTKGGKVNENLLRGQSGKGFAFSFA